jgi:hypothetical protein
MHRGSRRCLAALVAAGLGLACSNPSNIVPVPDSGAVTSSGGAGAFAPSSGATGSSSGGGPVDTSSSSGAGDDGGGSPGTDSGDDGSAPPGDDAGSDSSPTFIDATPGDDGGDGGGLDATPTDVDALSPSADAAPPPADAPASDGLSCHNLGCFDVFDCAIYHPVEFGPCGFTQCVNFVCQ